MVVRLRGSLVKSTLLSGGRKRSRPKFEIRRLTQRRARATNLLRRHHSSRSLSLRPQEQLSFLQPPPTDAARSSAGTRDRLNTHRTRRSGLSPRHGSAQGLQRTRHKLRRPFSWPCCTRRVYQRPLDQGRPERVARRRVVPPASSASLGNTPAVCRKSYIDPRVLDSLYSGDTITDVVKSLTEPADPRGAHLLEIERSVISLLTPSSEARV